MALGNNMTAADVIQLNLQIQPAAVEGHMVPCVNHNLLSMNMLAAKNYITIFGKDKVSIYNANNTKIYVFRQAILEGWHVKKEGLWQISLVKNVHNINTDTIVVTKSSSELLQSAQPPTKQIISAYELKTKSELICYYHTATRFPTKPTWLAAIQNKWLASWISLSAAAVTKYFPKLEETWKGHGRKTGYRLQSTN